MREASHSKRTCFYLEGPGAQKGRVSKDGFGLREQRPAAVVAGVGVFKHVFGELGSGVPLDTVFDLLV